jgi:DNA-binding CsgD family transcriptional regulator
MQHTDLVTDDEVDGLTDKQRAVLDLVLEHKSSKEIARALGISPHAVDQRIKTARNKLAAGSRAELARIYLRQRSMYGEPVYRFPQVAEPSFDAQESDRDQPVEPVFTLSDVSQFQMAAPWQSTPVRLSGLEALDNRFGIAGRIGAIAVLAAIIALMLLVMMAVAETLSRLI